MRAGRVGWGTLFAYGPSVAGLMAPTFLIQLYFLNYATDVLLLSPVAIALLFALVRAWDAISDPLVGYWSDRTRSRWGRRRPWMVVSTPLIAVTFVAVWNPPAGLSATKLLLWEGAALFAYYTAFTAWFVPHQSLGAELTDDHHDRTRVFALRHVFFMVGIFIAFAAMQAIRGAGDPEGRVAGLTLALAVVSALALLVPPAIVGERPELQGRVPEHPVRAFGDVLANPHARLLLFVWFIEMTALGTQGVLSPYVMIYLVQRPDLIGIAPAALVVGSISGAPLWVALARRFGKRGVWRTSMVGAALSFGAMAFLGPDRLGLLVVLLLLGGATSGAGLAIGPSVLADVIDDDESRTGSRKEGVYSAALGFAMKAGQGGIILLVGFLLEASGFRPNVKQPTEVLFAIKLLLAGVPFVAYLAGSILFGRFTLDEAAHARIQEALRR